MQIFSFKVADGCGYEATIAISGNINLYGLAEHIIDTIGFDFDHAFGFYDGLKNPYNSKVQYTLFADMGEGKEGDLSVNRTLIQEACKPKQKMLFLFDYGDDWEFLITCVSVEEADHKRKVRKVISTKGTAPIQYPDYEEEEE